MLYESGPIQSIFIDTMNGLAKLMDNAGGVIISGAFTSWDTWSYLVITYDPTATTAEIYVDNTKIATDSNTGDLTCGTTDHYVGSTNLYKSLLGYVKEYAIVNSVLS